MGRADSTDPVVQTPVPLDGDGRELLGTVIDGRYRLDATLGRGGMGLVYRATQIRLRRPAAVKILHPSLAVSPDVRNRFEREALAIGKIDHPNCVSVYDVGWLPDGARYLAMELLDGRPLADVLEQEGQIAPGRALHILAGILRGLSHIHANKLIHRDIKPENIFLIRHGQDEDFAKILDFGIAKPMEASDLDDGVKLTQAGMAFGTPIYMAPEQALGNPMDGRADLYAAAVLGYEMLCGHPPFYSDDKLEVMSMHTARPVPPMRQRMVRGGRPVPASIERLIARGLTKKPSDRYATAEDFLAEVESALRTPDGGVTDVIFERRVDTGSMPLVTSDGQVHITGGTDLALDPAASDSIAEAISDALSSADTSTPVRAVMPQAASASRSGVGLGLPYTGPSGEPIFGLTPEQRLAGGRNVSDPGVAASLEPDPRPPTVIPHVRKRLGLYLVIATCAIAIGVVGALVTSNMARDAEPAPPPNVPAPESPAHQANEAFEHGDVARALQILDANKAAIAADPPAQLVLGHVRASRNENGLALEAYAKALTLAPAVESDDRMRASLRAMTQGRTDYPVVAQAFDMWVGRTNDPDAKKALLQAAVNNDLATRKAVRPVIERQKLVDQVDWLSAYSLDLVQDEPCEARKTAVGNLRALGDQRAIPALQRAVVKVKPVFVRKGRKVTKTYTGFNACLVDDATAAIGYLRGLKP